MNLRLVLRTYAAYRQMSPDDVALLETLRALNDSEREAFVEALADKPQKKSSKKSPAASKSRRASGIGEQLSSRRQEKAAATTDDIDGDKYERCQAERDGGKVCFLLPDHNVHHLTNHPNHHPFTSPAPAASNQSPANGEVESTGASSGTAKDDAGVVVHGASGGD